MKTSALSLTFVVFVAVALLAVPGVSNAIPAGTLLAPGGGGTGPGATVDPTTEFGSSMTVEASTGGPFSYTSTGGVTIAGNYAEWVVLDQVTGKLDFLYQFQVTTGNVLNMAVSNYTGFTTYLGQGPAGYNIIANQTYGAGTFTQMSQLGTTARDSGGDTITLGWNTIPNPNGVKVGQESYVEVISTYASNFTTGAITLQDGASVNLTGFEPLCAIPEPATLLLLGSGLIGLAAFRKRFKKA